MWQKIRKDSQDNKRKTNRTKHKINTEEDKTVGYKREKDSPRTRVGQDRQVRVAAEGGDHRSAPHNHHDAGTKGVPVRHTLLGQPLS